MKPASDGSAGLGKSMVLTTLRHDVDVVRGQLVRSPVATRLRSSKEFGHG